MNQPVKAEKPKPYLSLDEEYLPEIKSWRVGGKYKINATIKMKSMSHSEESGMNATFDVIEINDKAFKDKSYKDIMDEEMEAKDTPEEETAENE